jgi:PAS domain S-box-containing protein
MRTFKSPVDNSSDVTSIVTADGKILHAFASSVNVLGYLPKEIVGRNTFDLIHPEDSVHSRCALGAVLSKPPGPRQVNVRVRRKDGEWRWVESTISNLLGEARIGAIVVHYREVGEKKARMKSDGAVAISASAMYRAS